MYLHGGIGYVDLETILAEGGYQVKQLPETVDGKPAGLRKRFLAALKLVRAAVKTDEWILVYPVYGRLNQWLIRALVKKGVKVTMVIGDIDGLKDMNSAQLQKDIRFLQLAHRLVVHNAAMKNWLLSQNVKKPMAELQLFDFLAQPCVRERSKSFEISFAGNLEKSTFLWQTVQPDFGDIRFRLYGRGLPAQQNLAAHFEFKGSYPAIEMPSKIEGSFGLLWDGDDWQKPAGAIGLYMPFISHHKLSLYILAGLPILAPRSAGSAAFIEKEQLGFLFDDPPQLPILLQSISEEQYQTVREQQKKWANRICQGEQIRQALKAFDNL